MSRGPNQKGQPPRRVLPHTVWSDAQAAIEVLIDHERYLPDTRDQFAVRMGWVAQSSGAIDVPQTQRVHDVCALTKDMSEDAMYGGMLIVYAPNRGGMVLVDPDSDVPDIHLVHFLVGDMQRQQTTKTINQRRLHTWRQVGQSFFNAGDPDMARLMWQAEDEINRTGFVDSTTQIAIFKALRAKGLIQ